VGAFKAFFHSLSAFDRIEEKLEKRFWSAVNAARMALPRAKEFGGAHVGREPARKPIPQEEY
jgi:hypothetical protein